MLMIRLRKRKIDILAEALEYRINCEPDILISKANLKDYIEAVIH